MKRYLTIVFAVLVISIIFTACSHDKDLYQPQESVEMPQSQEQIKKDDQPEEQNHSQEQPNDNDQNQNQQQPEEQNQPQEQPNDNDQNQNQQQPEEQNQPQEQPNDNDQKTRRRIQITTFKKIIITHLKMHSANPAKTKPGDSNSSNTNK